MGRKFALDEISTFETMDLLSRKPPVEPAKKQPEGPVKRPAIKPPERPVKPSGIKRAITAARTEGMTIPKLLEDYAKESEMYQAEMLSIGKAIEQKKEEYKKFLKENQNIIDEYSKKISEQLKDMEKAVTEGMPPPPRREDVIMPQSEILRIIKTVTPVIMGTIALLSPGRYGENLAFYNSMVDAIRRGDAEKYEQALEEWENSLNYALLDREAKIKSAEVAIRRIQAESEAALAKYGINKEILKEELETEMRKLDSIRGLMKDSFDTMKSIANLMINYEKLKVMRQRLAELPTVAKTYQFFKQLPEEEKKEFLRFWQKGYPVFPFDLEIGRRLTPEQIEEMVKQ